MYMVIIDRVQRLRSPSDRVRSLLLRKQTVDIIFPGRKRYDDQSGELEKPSLLYLQVVRPVRFRNQSETKEKKVVENGSAGKE